MSTNITPYQPSSFSELEAFCQRVCKSGMVPRQYQGKPDDAFVAIAYGAEVGLPPLAALQHVAVINGRPGLYGDAIAGVALKSGAIISIDERIEGDPATMDCVAHCTVTRPDGSVVERSFSAVDAKRAGLWGKAGPWSQFAQRMLAARARGYAVRDAAPHAFLGYTVEELRDIDTVRGPDAAKDITPPAGPVKSPRQVVQEIIDATPAPEPEPEEMLEIVKIMDGPTALYTGSILREAAAAYGKVKGKSADKAATALANLDALKVMRDHAEGNMATRLQQEIEVAEALAPVDAEAA
jgi:hypothetical protein